MKVAIVAGPYVSIPPKKYGGIEQVVYYIIKGLKELGHEPILIGPGDSEVDCKIIPNVDKAILFAKTSKELPEFNKKVEKANQKTKQILRKLIDKKEVDIIHSHGFDLHELDEFEGFPNLTTLHNKIGFDEIHHFMERRNLYYVSISHNQQSSLPKLQYAGVVYNGLDPYNFPTVTEPEDYLSFLGRFDRDKNPHLAIQLAINLGMKIKVAGKIDYQAENYFKSQIEPLLSDPLVEYIGEIDFKEKIKLLSKAKCNLHPTGFREPFGLTLLEAAYCGTPTLAISRGSIPELIEDGRTGVLVEDFIEGFHRLDECFQMNRGYISTRARSLFNYKTMTLQYMEVYKKIIEIFQKKQEQNDLIVNLLTQTKEGLDDIWNGNKNQQSTDKNNNPFNSY